MVHMELELVLRENDLLGIVGSFATQTELFDSKCEEGVVVVWKDEAEVEEERGSKPGHTVLERCLNPTAC